MKKISIVLLVLMAMSCTESFNYEGAIIPQPQSLKKTPGYFRLQTSTMINYDAELENEAIFLTEYIKKQTGQHLKKTTTESQRNFIRLELSNTIKSSEGYEIFIDGRKVLVTAKTATGIFYGIQSLMQLIPLEQAKTVKVPAVNIADEPRFSYRGMHLDVCRHFFDVTFIKKTLDAMAVHKLNRFHWHLTEDQGWRIEIKKYPELTEIGAWRNSTLIGHASDEPEKYDSVHYGGFYTREQIKEVIAYAAAHHITVIPEIELPGHAQAALATYPELGCFNEQVEVWNKWGISKNVYCAGKESTFEFLENVLSEVAELFPGEYIHIGGDECLKENWEICPQCQLRMKNEGLADEHELQSYFIRRIERFLSSKGKKIIGWDEILEGGLAENATVMSWRGEEGGIAAAQMHHDVIMTPNPICYFDHYQGPRETEPLAIGGFTDLAEVYGYDPVPAVLNDTESKHIIGTQANVWTEYITTPEHAEYMIFPRMCALSEISWTAPENKNFDNFMLRLRKHEAKLKLLGLNYRPLDTKSD